MLSLSVFIYLFIYLQSLTSKFTANESPLFPRWLTNNNLFSVRNGTIICISLVLIQSVIIDRAARSPWVRFLSALFSSLVLLFAVFSHHQLWCQINELFDSQKGKKTSLLSEDTRRRERANVEEQWSHLAHNSCISPQEGKEENIWNFNDSERNTVFRKCDGKMERWKCPQQRSLKIKQERQHARINFTCFQLKGTVYLFLSSLMQTDFPLGWRLRVVFSCEPP